MRTPWSCFLILVASTAQAGVATGDIAVLEKAFAPVPRDASQANAVFGMALASDGTYAAVGSPGRSEPLVAQGRVTIFRREMSGWRALTHVLAPSAPAAQDRFGQALALEGEWLAIGRPGREVGAVVDAGSVHLYRQVGGVWQHAIELFAPSVGAGDSFGYSVALSGTVLVIGAPEDDIGSGANRGSAHVYRLVGNTWGFVATLTAPDGAADDVFGLSVDVSGARALIGAPGHDSGGQNARGSAYLFENNGADVWNFVSSFVPADTVAVDLYGSAVAIDGDNFVVGAPFHDPGGIANQGAAYAYHRVSSNSWSQTIKFVAGTIVPDTMQARFGTAVALEGSRCAIGAPYADNGGVSTNGRGAVWNYLASGGGTSWVEVGQPLRGGGVGDLMGVPTLNGDTVLVGAPFSGVGDEGLVHEWQFIPQPSIGAQLRDVDGAGADQYGTAVALNKYATRLELAIGAPGDDTAPQILATGPVQVYRNTISTFWDRTAIATPVDSAMGDALGSALDFDGDLLLIGSPLDDVGAFANQGSAHLFARAANGVSWDFLSSIVEAPVQSNANYGGSVVLDGNLVAIGAPRRTIGANADQGIVALRNCGAPSCNNDEGVLFANGLAGDRFGYDVALDGGLLVIGVPFWNLPSAADAGTVFVFQRNATNTGWTLQAQIDTPDPAAGDNFGNQVAVDFTRQTIVVSASGNDIGTSIDVGSLYVFERRAGAWTLTSHIVVSGPGLRLATQLALEDDRLLATAENFDGGLGANTGRAYLFERVAGGWEFRYTINAPEPQAGARFGAGASLSLHHAAIGAPDWRNSAELGAQAEGRVYLFQALGHVIFRDDFE